MLYNEKGHSVLCLTERQRKLRQKHDQSSPGSKAIVEKIIVSEIRNKSKRVELQESQAGIRVRKLAICKRSFEITKENYSRVYQVYQFHQNKLASPPDGR